MFEVKVTLNMNGGNETVLKAVKTAIWKATFKIICFDYLKIVQPVNIIENKKVVDTAVLALSKCQKFFLWEGAVFRFLKGGAAVVVMGSI